MEPIELFDKTGNSYFSLELKPAGWLRSTWSGSITDEKVIEGGQKLIEATRITGCAFLINDNSELEGSWLSALDWIESELEPALRKAGNKYLAHVLARDFINKFSAIELEARLSVPTFKIFYTLKDAEDWMRSVM